MSDTRTRTCERCGHLWEQRGPTKPRWCPDSHSNLWDFGDCSTITLVDQIV